MVLACCGDQSGEKSLQLSTIQQEDALVGSDPESAVGACLEKAHGAFGKGVAGRRLPIVEAQTVKANQPAPRSQPQISVGCLRQGGDSGNIDAAFLHPTGVQVSLNR